MSIITLEYATTTPCSVLKKLPTEDKEWIADLIVAHYRKVGFPYYSLTDAQKTTIPFNLLHFPSYSLDIEENELQQVMLGLEFVNSYHPQMWEVPCAGNMSPMQLFNNDQFFKRAILKRIEYSVTKLRPYNIRKSLMVFGSQRVSNFRPTVAKYIYEKYCPKEGKVLDPCAGYGGRLFGAWASETVAEYTGVDPDKRQINGNAAMADDLNKLPIQRPLSVILKKQPFEDFKGFGSYYDLVFTSPPYFDTEIYSCEKTQSWYRYRTYDKWVSKFLYPLIFKSHFLLKKGGYFALNVGKKIEKEAVDIGCDIFGEYEIVYQMRLSRVLGSHNPNKFKLEPIYVWRK